MASRIPRLPFTLYAARETHKSAAYYWNNRRRAPSALIVVQRTVSGEAFFEEDGERRRVGRDYAMLFTHCEDSAYGFPADAEAPYVTDYAAVTPGAGLRELFDTLRSEFGSVVRMAEGGEAETWLQKMRTGPGGAADSFARPEACFRLLLALYREQLAASGGEDAVEALRRRMESDYREPVRINELAREAGRSREHLIRAFRSRHGVTPGAYLMRLRMEHAKQLFCSTRLAAADVARQCGYAHTASFMRAYRTWKGRETGRTRP
ncbi:MAG: helix-turn-helix transcriptional regulator [Opitutales bacterium]|nr:helix-turn-helix transcriptional regulator [Opitutales bacterium]